MSCYNCGPSKKDNLAKKLNKKGVFLRQTDEKDSYNQPLDVWIPVVPVWSAIEPLQGRELYAAMQVNAEVTTRIGIRWRPGIDRTMRYRYKNTEFEIMYIIHPEFAERELHLMCKERQ